MSKEIANLKKRIIITAAALIKKPVAVKTKWTEKKAIKMMDNLLAIVSAEPFLWWDLAPDSMVVMNNFTNQVNIENSRM